MCGGRTADDHRSARGSSARRPTVSAAGPGRPRPRAVARGHLVLGGPAARPLVRRSARVRHPRHDRQIGHGPGDGNHGRLVGSSQLHPGAVYVHLGVTHLIESLDLDAGIAVARRERPGYTTVAQSVSDLRIRSTRQERPLPGDTASSARSEVFRPGRGVSNVRSAPVGSSAANLWPCHPATCGPRPCGGVCQIQVRGVHRPGPGRGTCRRTCVDRCCPPSPRATGGTSGSVHRPPPGHRRTDGLRVRRLPRRRWLKSAVADARRHGWLSATLRVISSCDCATGCPGVCNRPSAATANDPLDKRAGAALLLRHLLG